MTRRRINAAQLARGGLLHRAPNTCQRRRTSGVGVSIFLLGSLLIVAIVSIAVATTGRAHGQTADAAIIRRSSEQQGYVIVTPSVESIQPVAWLPTIANRK